jgi:type II secretory pathway component GspD/PulD (secretin)
VARAKAGSWIKLVAGFVVGAAAQPLFTAVAPVAVSGAALLAAVPVPGRPSQAHEALNNAIGSHRRGEYEIAAVQFQEVLARQDDLTETEKQEFARFWEDNVRAIDARREGAQQLRLAERAILEGRLADANDPLKKVAACEQYLSPADRAKFKDVSARLRGRADAAPQTPRPIPVTPTPLPGVVRPPAAAAAAPAGKPDLPRARAALKQARAEFEQANLDAAEKQAKEAELMGVVFPPAEDTPAKLLKDIAAARTDAKTLLAAARAAQGRKDYAAAEKYAKQADAAAGTFTFPLWADSPSKLLKELEVQKAKPAVAQAPKPETPAAKPPAPPQEPGRFDSVKEFLGFGGKPEAPPQEQPKPGPAAAVTTSNKPAPAATAGPDRQTNEARALVAQGRKALEDKNVAQAKQLADKAKALKPSFEWWEDTPEKLLADIDRAQAKANPAKPPAPATPAAPATAAAPPSPPAPASPKKPTTKEEAVALVKAARAQLADGKFDEAQTSAVKAKSVTVASWGLFEDSPDSLLKDIDKARTKHNQEEAVKVLAEGRTLLEKGDWEGAQRMAYKAQNLHGPYGILDFGDRPDKLLADAQALRGKARKPDAAVVKKDEPKPAGPTPPVAQAPKPDVKPGAATQAPPVTVAQGPKPGDGKPNTQPQPTTVAQGPKPGDGKPPTALAPTSVLNVSPLPPLDPPGAQDRKPDPELPPLPAKPDPAAVNRDAIVKGQALQMLSDARARLKAGDLDKARGLVGEVTRMKVTYGAGDDTPTAVTAEIDRVAQAKAAPPAPPPQVTAAPPVPPPQPAQPAQPAVDPVKAQALRLLAEGRAMQKAGRLLEAQQKCLQALQTGARFGPDDDDPAQAMQQITTLAMHRVAALAAQATELAAYGSGEPMARYQKAEQQLQEAQQLARHFGLDTASVDAKAAYVQQLRGLAAADAAKAAQQPIQPVVNLTQPPVEPPAPPQPAAGGVSKGAELLDAARGELRAGAIAQARRLAMDAIRDEYGVQQEAQAVLRTIDSEDFNIKVREAQRTFEAAQAAYNRRQYEQAGLMIGAIDTRLLDDRNKERLREMMQTPGMKALRPDAVAKEGPPPPGDEAAHVHLTDQPPATPEKDILKNAAAMRVVQYQVLRKEGLDVQTAAREKFQAGQTEEALRLLQDYLARLDDVRNLDAGQLAGLRKPVENRLQQFKLMKIQTEFANADKAVAETKLNDRSKRLLAEESKQKKISDLMKQCNGLIKDQKFDDAYRLAMVAKEMDPDNEAITALVQIAKMRSRVKEAQDIKDGREREWLDIMNDNDRPGAPVTSRDPLFVDPQFLERGKKRQSLDTILSRKTPGMLEVERRLLTPVNINFKDVPLRGALDDLKQTYNLNVVFDENAVRNAPISLDRPVTLQLQGLSLKTALDLLLRNLNLTYVVKDGYVDITTKENAKGQLVRRVYQVWDLVIPSPNSAGAPQAGQPQSQAQPPGYAPTPLVPYGMSAGGSPVGSPTGGPSGFALDGAPGGAPNLSNGTWVRSRMQTREDALIKLITSTVEPLSWSDQGSSGTIDYFPMTGTLVINQTLDIQEQVADLLQALRRLQDQEVAIEVRLITVDEDYYERIGLDFSMNIIPNNKKYEPALLTGAFAPPGFINNPNTGALRGLIAGLTPAGTLTPDLGIPIVPNSYSVAVPPFGGYQGPGVGGLALGLAFLSDIQVSLFLEAVAGDARSSISQSPRVTLQNGDTATISISENMQNLVTNINFTQLPNGSFAVVPQVQQNGNTVTLVISAVLTADRRFVRLTPSLSLSNISISTPVPQFPVLLPIYPGLNTADPGNAVVFTQYVQQPRTSSITVNTTVTVPDGGTVVMGGLKRMSEGRLEFGPPVLSKIPYIDRLFRNVGYGRSGTSVLIMVTPRIIIQEEEEERATGFRLPAAVGP